jgi:N-acylneuraminate cytidylyltransferase
MRYIAIIPARSGSKGVPNKNLKELNGKPLIVWSIEQALSSQVIDRVIVSTDSRKIAEVAIAAGAEVPALRPAEIAQDLTPTEAVLIHAVQNWSSNKIPDAVILLQPTSPIRLPKSIRNAVIKFEHERADSLLAVSRSHAFFWKNNENPIALYDFHDRPRRQDIKKIDELFRETGSIYITKTNLLLEYQNRLGGRISLFETDDIESLDIDTELDFIIAEAIMKSSALFN